MASKNTGYGWLTGSAAPQSGGYTSRWAKYAQDQAKLQAAADFNAQQTQQADQAKQDNKNIFQKAGDVVGGVASSVADSWNHGVGDVGRVIQGSMATNDQANLQKGANDIQNKANKQISDIYGKYQDAGKVTADGGADPNQMSAEDKAKIAELQKQKDQQLTDYKKSTNFDQKVSQDQAAYDASQKVDAKKTALDTASNFLDVATLGIGGLAKTGGKAAVEAGVKAAAVAGSKTAAERIAAKATTDAVTQAVAKKGAADLSRTLVGSAAEGAIINGTYGGVQAGANGQDVGQGILQGAATGAGLGVVGNLGGKLIRKALGKDGKQLPVDPNAPKDTTAPAPIDPNAPPAGQKLLGDGLPSSKDIAAQIQDLQNGNFSPDLMHTTDTSAIDTLNGTKAVPSTAGATTRPLDVVTQDLQAIQDKTGKYANMSNVELKQSFSDVSKEKTIAEQNATQTGFTNPQDPAAAPVDANGNPVPQNPANPIQSSATNVNKDAVKAKFAELQTQYQDALAREANVAKSAADARLSAAPKVADVQQAAADYAAGNKPDTLYTPDPQPTSILDVVNNPKLPPEVKKSAQAVLQQANDARLNAPNFMDTATYTRSKQGFVDEYNAAIKDLKAMPDSPYKQQKIDELTNTLDQNMQNLDGMYNDTAAARQHDQQINDFVNQKESQIVMDAQRIMDSNPTAYRTLNPGADAAYQAELHTKLYEAKTAEFMQPTTVPDSVTATDELVHAADTAQTPQEFVDKLNTDPVAQKASDTVAANADTAAVAMKQNPMSTSIVGRVLGIPRDVIRSWGEAGQQFADKLDNAMFDYTSHRGTQILRVRQWDELLGKSEKSRANVFDALDSGNVDKLSANELTVYKDAREYFNEMADKLGINPEGRITDYVPHLIKTQTGKDAAALDQTIQLLKYGKDAKGNPLTSTVRRNLSAQLSGLDPATMRYLDLNTSYQFKNGFLEKRTGATGFQRNLLSVVNLYDTLGARKVYLEPAMQDIAKTVADKGNGFSASQQRYVTDLFNNLRGTNKSELQTALDGMLQKVLPIPDASGRAIRGFRRLTNAGLMGGSVSTALKNTQAFVNIAAKIHPADLPHAVINAGKSLRADSSQWRELYQAGVMDASFSNFIRDISHEGGGKVTQAIDKAEVPLWTMMRNVDQLGRATAYFAKRDSYLKGIGKTLDNATPAELRGAMQSGRKGARDTSFEFTPLDVPVALDGDMGKLALQMQSWNLQQANFVKNLIHGHEDSLISNGKLNAKGVYSILGFMAGTAGFYYSVGSAVGMNPAELIPFGTDITQGQMPQSPIFNLLGVGGDAKNPGLYQIATASDQQRGATAAKVGSKFLTNLIPGSAQAQRTIKGLDSTSTGVSKNKNGQVQFVQNTDTKSQLQAAVFGKYSTQAGHEWVSTGFPTLSDTQTKTVDGLGTQDAKKKTAEFFIALNQTGGRQDALTNVKAAIAAGDANKATRLANDYNSKVKDSLKKYYADYQDIPAVVGYDQSGNELTGSSYLTDKLINVSKYSK